MSPNSNNENGNPTTLQEAINIIKFLKTTHKLEIAKWKETCQKHSETIKKLESNRKKELEFLSKELHKYEVNLALRTETVARQLAERDELIAKQNEIIDDLKIKLEMLKEIKEQSIPEIVFTVDSNSDSGIAMENEDSGKSDLITDVKLEPNKSRKCRRFADSISFFRRVDFSPMKNKACRDRKNSKPEESRKHSLDVPYECNRTTRLLSADRMMFSDDERPLSAEPALSDSGSFVRRKKMNDSMNNHFSDDGSEDTSEEVFDRVMTRSSIRRSVKANPKYKKISRTKSKLLEQVKVNITD